MVRIPPRPAAPPLRLLAVVLLVAACSSSPGIGGIGKGGGEGGGASPCGSCSDVYTNGGIACGPGDSADAWRALADCACGAGVCAGSCTMSFCANNPADMGCSACLGFGLDAGAPNCAAQVASCGSN